MVEDGYKRIMDEQLAGKEALDVMYKQGKEDAIREMLELSYEWKDNHGSFLDFQRVLYRRLEGL